MKRSRAALLAAVVALLVLPILGETAQADWTGGGTARFVPEATLTDSCADNASLGRAPLNKWHMTASANSDKVPVLTFAVFNDDATPDTLSTVVITSVIERAFSVERVYLYWDKNKDSSFVKGSGTGDSLLSTVDVTTRFETNDQVSFAGIGMPIPADSTFFYHVVVDIFTDTVITRPFDFDTLGVGVHVFGNDITLQRQGLETTADAINPCYPLKQAGYNIIFDTAPLKVDDVYYTVFHGGGCSDDINLGDSLWVFVDVNNSDTANVGSIQVYLKEFGGTATPKTLTRVNNNTWQYRWLIPYTTSTADGIDVAAGFHYLVCATEDKAGNDGRDSALVTDPIDTDKPYVKPPQVPATNLSFDLYYDANGNDIVNVGDTIRVTAALQANDFGEVEFVWTYIYGWDTDSIYVPMYDSAGDRKFQGKLEVPAGILDDTTATVIQIHAVDNQCNVDSNSTWMANDVDLTLPNGWSNLTCTVLLDADSNNCMGIGEEIRIQVQNSSSDVVAVYANMMFKYYNAGWLDPSPAGSVAQVPLVNVSGTTWRLDWTLGEYPQDSAMDVASDVALGRVWAEDDGGNVDSVNTGTIARAVDTEYPVPVEDLECRSVVGGNIELTWGDEDSDAEWFAVFYDNGTGTINYADTIGSVFGTGNQFWTTDGTVDLVSGTVYKFDVWTVDNCGNWERVHPLPVACMSDDTPPEMCVFQPDTGGVYGAGNNITIFVRPKDAGSNDVAEVRAIGRLLDRGDGQPGAWHYVSSWEEPYTEGEVVFSFELDEDSLDLIVPTGQCQTVQIAILTVDLTGNTNTPDMALADCSPVFHFDWCRSSINVLISTINDELPLAQPYCGNQVGFSVWGPDNPVLGWAYGGGRAPYMAVAWVTHYDPDLALGKVGVSPPGDTIYYAEGLTDSIATFNLDATGFEKGEWTLYLKMTDAAGSIAQTSVMLCVPDSLPPCAIISSPVDGKCIHRSHSSLDPVDIEVEIDAYDNCIDPNGVAKVDFDWALTCDEGATWNNIGIVPGDGGDTYDIEWMNRDDLDWVEESGTIIYLRARIYDGQGNIYTTACVAVCVDIDTPPMCIASPNLCVNGDVEKLTGSAISFTASLNWAEGNVDDIDQVYLYYKKSSDPDLYGNWTQVAQMEPATNNTFWRYDNFSTTELTDQVYYDFRVIVHTIWDTWSYDLNGDGTFDPYTFDADNCDGATWFIDNSAPNIHVDTLWTSIDGQQIVQPNVGCTMSDPRGWAWAQYGQSVTVQPLAEPFGDMDDIVKVQWTLYEGGDGDDEAECDCGEGFDENDAAYKVLGILEGADALDAFTFNPTMAPFVTVQSGYQYHVLRVQAWDACGNESSDCIELYLLDIDKTEAIIISPKNHEVFCQGGDQTGEITVTAQTLLNEKFRKAIFAYRAFGSQTWIPFDSTNIGVGGTEGNQSVTWYPHALGLADGQYELTVWAEDDAGNRQTNLYVTNVHLSCGVPTVEMMSPAANAFIGCPIEVVAMATAPDAYNYITRVDFYYQSVTSSEASSIGTDYYSRDGQYSVAWSPSLNGDYYIWARVTVKSGVTAYSEKVWVRMDDTAPEVYMVEVGGDRSNGGSGDPTVVTAGDDVDIFVDAFDRLQADGYGPEDNCGLDSVKIYVKYGSTVIFGELTHPVSGNTFTATWPTAGLINGTYQVYAVATDSCCNTATSGSWYVSIVNPVPGLTIDVVEDVFYCDVMNARDSINILGIVGETDLVDVDSVEIWGQPASSSDVYDQWTKLGSFLAANNQGSGIFPVGAQTSAWDEGLHRLRAVLWVNGRGSDDGNDSDTKFDDFSFNDANLHHMLLNIDRSAPTPTFALAKSVISADSSFRVTIQTPACGNCDIVSYEYGVVTQGGVYGTRPEFTTTSCTFTFDPVDSGLVTLHNCYWGGYIRVTAYDALGNGADSAIAMWVDILDVPDKYALVTSPAHGSYVEGTVSLAAKVVGTVDSTVFFYSTSATGTKTWIAKLNGTASWNTASLADGQYFLWATAYQGGTARTHDAACAVPVVVANTCARVYLGKPVPYGTCHADGQVMFIGGTVDLKLDSLISATPIDSVVFMYKTLDAPGGFSPNGDPANGFVAIATDRYAATSWDVSWNVADTTGEAEVIEDGYYVIQAFTYDRSGRLCHSNAITLFIDNTAPYSEISEVNGDQTLSTCADVTAGEQVKIVAVAIDDRSPLGPSSAYNSCARFVQFFAGACGEGGTGGGVSGQADIVFVIDYSGSMGEETANVIAAGSDFANALAGTGLDYNLGLVEACSPMNVVQTMTSSTAAFISALNSASCGGGVQSYDALTGIADGSINVGFRSGSARFIILITDTSPESGTASSIEFCNTPSPTEETTVANAMVAGGVTLFAVVETPTDPSYSGSCAAEDHNAYDAIVAATNGDFFDLDAQSYTALFTDITDAIVTSIGVAGQTPVGIIWGKTVDLNTDAPEAFWNTTGLTPGEYCLWTVVTDNVGNSYASDLARVCVYDKTPPVAWIAGFGDATLACPPCETHRIYALTCDIDVTALKFEMQEGEGEWVTIGVTSSIDSTLWFTDWNQCGLEGTYKLRAVPVSDHYEVGTEQHIMYDVDASIQPILEFTVGANCALTYGGGTIGTISFEDKSSGNLGIAKVTMTGADTPYMLGVYQPLGENALSTEKVDLVRQLDVNTTYYGNFNDEAILLGGAGSFFASYYVGTTSYLKMSDLSVSRVYPQLGMPGTLNNVTTGASLFIERDAVSSTNGVIILPALVPTQGPDDNDVYKVWPSGTYLPAIKFTSPLEGGFNTGKYAKIKIPYSANAPVPDSLTVVWWHHDEWETEGIFFGGDAAGFNATARTVEFWAMDLHGVYAVVSDAGSGPIGPITVQHQGIVPQSGAYTSGMPTFYTLVRSNISGNDNNWDIDPDQIHVKLDGVTIYNDGEDADGFDTDWDEVSGMLVTHRNFWDEYDDPLPPLSGGSHTYWVQAKTYQGWSKSITTTFTVDNTPPAISFPHDYVSRNPEFKIVISDAQAGLDLDSIQADVYDFDLSLGTEIPSNKLIYEEHASGFRVAQGAAGVDTLIFSLTSHLAQYRRLLVVLWDGSEEGRYLGEDDDDRDFSDYAYVYSPQHGVGDLVGNKATPVMRMFTVKGTGGDGDGEEAYNEPNPFDPRTEPTTIYLNGFDGGNVSVKLYDLAGEKVLTLAEGAVFNVGQEIVWDGKVDGKYVASGVYLCHIAGTSGGRSSSAVLKIAVVKRD